MAAARAAMGEAGRGSAALLPAIAAAGAGTGSGGTSDDGREPYSTGEYQGKSGIADTDIGPLTPAIKKEAVAVAKAEIPKEDRKGFGYEDLMMFGLQLMGNKSPNFGTAFGEAGIAALTAKQAREKAAGDQQKEAAMARYYEKYGNYLDSEGARKAAEDKPQMQYQKAIDNAIAKLKEAPEYKFAKTPAEKTQMENNARATVKASFLSVYPELADTLGGTPSVRGEVIDFNSIK